MPKGIPLSEEDQKQRRREIYRAASGLFLDKGFQETSMREIADAAGMGKSSLYDYFRTKDEILLFVLLELSDELLEQARQVACLELPADRRLRKVMEVDLDFLARNRKVYLKLSLESQKIKPGSQERLREQRYVFQDLVRRIIVEGIEAGIFRKVEPLLCARLLINSMASVMFTSRPTANEKDMLAETLDIFFHGLYA